MQKRYCLVAAAALGICSSLPAFAAPVTDGLILWLDGDDLDGDGTSEGLGESGLTGSSVNVWADKATTGGAQSAVQSGTDAPTYTPNGLNTRSVLTFNSGNLVTPAFDPVAQPQVYIVWKSNVADGATSFATDGLSAANRTLIDYEDFVAETPNRFGAFAGPDGRIQNYSAPMAFDEAVYETVSFNLNGTGMHNIRIDGVEVANNTEIGDRGDAFTGFTLGSLNGEDARLNGYIAEVLVYNAPLSATDRDAVEAYLNDKWFVVVPEPSALALLGLGALSMLRRRR